jgi:hypothetical protein
MVTVRPFHRDDIAKIDKIWREHYSNESSLPDRNNIVTDVVAETEKGELVAYGQVRLFAEAMLFLDKNASQRDKVQALKLLMLEAFRGTQIAGLKELYCFANDPDFATLIERHFGFAVVDKGELLYREEV